MVQARRNTAVLLAGGVGSRVGLALPKQLVELAGRPMIEHPLAVFDEHPEVDDILVMMAPGHLDAVRAIVRAGGYAKVRDVHEGGETRSETTRRALAALGSEDGKVLLHDAARPLLTSRIVTDCIVALERYDAVVVAIPSSDTVIQVGPDDTVAAIPRRDDLRRVQTPQGFRVSVIRDAYRLAGQDAGFEATDDSGVVLRYLPQVPIRVVPGDERNLTVTAPIDLAVAERLLRERDAG